MRHILTMLLTLAGLAVMAQTNQPLPAGSKPLSNQLYLAPDSTVWTGDEFDGLFVDLGRWTKTDSLNKTRQKAFALDVTDFGAVGDSSTINTQAIKDAFTFATANGFDYVYIPKGTYLIDSVVHIPEGISVYGDGYDSHVIPVGDISRYQIPGSVTGAVFYNRGTQTFINELAGNLNEGATYLVDAAIAAAVAKDDILKIVDTTSRSWSGYRLDILKGEYFTVWKTNGDTVFFDHPVSDTYDNAANTLVSKMNLSTSKLYGLRIGANAVSPDAPRIVFENFGNTEFSDLYITGARGGNIRFSDGYNVTIDRVHSYQTLYPLPGQVATQYGMVIDGMQNFTVKNCTLFGIRHAITTGSSRVRQSVLTRFGNIEGCTLYSSDLMGADLHGASSDVTFRNNIMTGAQLRGRRHSLLNNTIIARTGAFPVIKIAEVKQLDFTISGNNVIGKKVFIWVDVTTTVATGGTDTGYEPDKGGNLIIRDNTFTEADDTPDPDIWFMRFVYSRPLTDTLESTIDFSGNTVTYKSKTVKDIELGGYGTGGRSGPIIASNNFLKGARLKPRYMTDFTSTDNVFESLPSSAYYIQGAGSVVLRGNVARNICLESGLAVTDACFALILGCPYTTVDNNSVFNWGTATQSVRYQSVAYPVIGTNFFGSLQPYFTGTTERLQPAADQFRLQSLNSAPASATATGTTGEIRVTATHIYVCTATNTWVRTALTTW